MTLPTEAIRKQQRRRRRQDRGQRHQSQQGLEQTVRKFCEKRFSLSLSNGRHHLLVTSPSTIDTTTILIMTLPTSLINAKFNSMYVLYLLLKNQVIDV
jgi:hypothetical protein